MNWLAVRFTGKPAYRWLLADGGTRLLQAAVVTLVVLLIAFGALEAKAQTAVDQASEQTAVDQAGEHTDNTAAEQSALPPELLNPAIELDELQIRLIPLTKAELADLAAAWISVVKANAEERVQVELAIRKSVGAAEDAERERLAAVSKEGKQLLRKFTAILSAWDKRGGEKATIAEYRAYIGAIIVEETQTTDVRTLVNRALEWLTSWDGGLAVARKTLVAAVLFYGLYLFAKICRSFFKKRIERIPNISQLLQAFLVNVFFWLVLFVGLMMVLAFFGINITPLFALFGGASFIIGFAMQDTLSNFANGLMIMVNQPFDKGDFVDLGGVSGTVKSVSITATTITTADNQVVVLPNKQVWGNVITNITANDIRRVDLVFGIGYDDDIGQAVSVLQETVAAHRLVLKDPEPAIMVGALAESSVNINCWPWAKTEDYWTVYWDLTHQVKERFDEAGISIPYPQRDIRVQIVRERQPRTA